MRLLADENIPLASIQALRTEGHDVLAVSESMAGAGDREVLARAEAERRVLVTFDRDFGALAFRHAVSASTGIVLLRFVAATPVEPAAVLADLFGNSGLTFSGKFTVTDRERIRQRSLQGKAKGG